MIDFPKIPSTKGFKHNRCFAFLKYDGTNVGFEWSKKRGWYKSRLRRGLFGADDPFVGWAIAAFRERYGDVLPTVFEAQGWDKVVAFGEAFGPSSFAGMHKQDEPHEVVLFDLWLPDYGFVGPADFIKATRDLAVPVSKCVYEGKFTGQLTEDVRNGKYASKGVVEGVVIKAGKGGEDLEYAKVKTYTYMERLKQVYADRWQEFWE